MSATLYNTSGKFKSFLFVLGILIIFFLLLNTQRLVQNLRTESRQILEFYAQLYVRAASDTSDSYLNFIFDEIIKRTDFPIVLSDKNGNPIAWKGVDIDPEDYSEKTLAEVRSLMTTMKREIEPIPLKYGDQILQYLYYGDSKSIKQLQRLPYVEISVVGLFILVGFFGFNSIRRSEQQFIWVGMAKETAHQLGTPISSLMGWTELLKSKSPSQEQLHTIDEMQHDIARLSNVAQRFSQIGSKADLKPYDINHLIQGVVSYFQRRLPQMGRAVHLQFESTLTQPVPINIDLFEWVLENLVKNALDAIGTQEGEITIRVTPSGERKHHAIIDVIDTGRGIENKDRKNIFRPGFSTKKRGWGLGLSLARRIIEGYHGGKLFLKETQLGKGTTMRIII